jgi:hypothetical protein
MDFVEFLRQYPFFQWLWTEKAAPWGVVFTNGEWTLLGLFGVFIVISTIVVSVKLGGFKAFLKELV